MELHKNKVLVKEYVDKATVVTLEIIYEAFVSLHKMLEGGFADEDLIVLRFVS